MNLTQKKLFSEVMASAVICLSLAGCSGSHRDAKAPEMLLLLGETLLADDSIHVNAHGGMILEKDGVYYWYGEHRGDGTPGSLQQGVSLYTSADLRNWKNRGIVLQLLDSIGHPLELGCKIERPKVIYNPATGKYVMWFHHELKDRGYDAAQGGVAVADTPEGPFSFIRSARVNPGIYPENLSEEDRISSWNPELEWWSEPWYDQLRHGSFVKRDLDGGQMARDMTLYVDKDGKAYHIYSSEDNLTIQIAELDSTFTNHTGRYIRVSPGGHNEAPAIFEKDGVYWMITSGCTGWAPNAARLLRAGSMMGEWTQLEGNPARGEGAETTFDTQGTYIFRQGDDFTFMADRWNPQNLGDSRHVWIPVKFDESGSPYLEMPVNTETVTAEP
ncbi:MAG: glycoside hydrolase family 43 protein [Muribaculaceae bacterium]|nr:glycoside hydrolase family 43 protein [Muribaculaceae bacterium]